MLTACVLHEPLSMCRNDKKMDRLLTGIGDGCDSCLAPPNSWADLSAVEAGFPKDRTIESLRATYDSLEKDSQGVLKKRLEIMKQDRVSAMKFSP